MSVFDGASFYETRRASRIDENSVKRNLEPALKDPKSSDNTRQKKSNARKKVKDEGGNVKLSGSDKTKIALIRESTGKIVEHKVFQLCILILIVINAGMMGISTFDFVRGDDNVERIFDNIDLAFLIIFTVEISLQFIYHGFELFFDGWLVFDFAVVSLSWIMGPYFLERNNSVRIFRSFRIFRALRLINRVKILRNLVNAIISVIPRMGSIMILLAVVFYIFGVMFTLLFMDAGKNDAGKDCTELDEERKECVILSYDYFGRLDHTFFTLFQVMTMDNWVDITREYWGYNPYVWAPFCSFVVVSGWIVVNLIVAVICDAVYDLNDFAEAITGQLDDSDYESDEESIKERFSEVGKKERNERILQEHVFGLKDNIHSLIGNQKKTLEAVNILANKLGTYDSKFKGRASITSHKDQEAVNLLANKLGSHDSKFMGQASITSHQDEEASTTST